MKQGCCVLMRERAWLATHPRIPDTLGAQEHVGNGWYTMPWWDLDVPKSVEWLRRLRTLDQAWASIEMRVYHDDGTLAAELPNPR